jgi:ATP-dependent DNA helicase RecQ
MLTILKKYFNHSSFRAPQEEIINHTIQGGNSLVIMPTGMGKSICYQIPALIQDGLTLVISPLIALMKDQVDQLKKKGIDAASINSSIGKKARSIIHSRLSKGKIKILYVTPERFRKNDFVEIIKARKISLLAVDEAHCISEWGHDFRPDYSRIKELRQLLDNPPTIALTATATPEVQKDIVYRLGLSPESISIFHQGIARNNLFCSVENVYGEEEKLSIITEVNLKTSGSGIVYFSLIKNLLSMSQVLTTAGIKHQCYHGDLQPKVRKSVQEKFMKSKNELILATNAFGMGVDKEDIRFIIHAEIPGSMESYYQEIGRAGRDNKKAQCILLYDQNDLLIQMDFIKWNNPDSQFYYRVYQQLVDNSDEINSIGIEGLKEKLLFKSRVDFRLETCLKMMERHNITTGSLEAGNLMVEAPLSEHFSESILAKKLNREQLKLQTMVEYANNDECRKALIHQYFGLPLDSDCGACDKCV